MGMKRPSRLARHDRIDCRQCRADDMARRFIDALPRRCIAGVQVTMACR